MVKLTSLTAFLFASVTCAKNVDVSEYGGVERMLQVNTDVPSAAPTIVCSESNEDEFYLKTRNKAIITQTCGWLKGQKDKTIKKHCSKKGKFGVPPASEVCVETCGICKPPTVSPVPTPAPITKPPTSCIEDEDDKFYFNKKETKTCGWLKGQKDKTIKKYCRKKKGKGEVPPASKVCVETCGICKPPTVSPVPTPAPKPCDAEKEEDEFFLKKNKRGDPIPGTCGSLDDKRPGAIAKICKTSKPYGDYDAARNVCVKTCKNCIE